MTTFFIGDTHFGHTNILTFEKEYRAFKDVEEMNEAIVENWNSVVGKNDTVWHLGDAVFGMKNAWYLGRLNGNKRLVLGNHDNLNSQVYLKYFNKLYGIGTVQVNKEFRIALTHIPVHECQFAHRFQLNIHGHLHSNFVKDQFGKEDKRYFNASCERVMMTPISLEEVLEQRRVQ